MPPEGQLALGKCGRLPGLQAMFPKEFVIDGVNVKLYVKPVSVAVRVTGPDLVYTVTEAEHQRVSEQRKALLQESKKKRTSLDVAFVMDVTGSMQSFIG